MSSAPTAERFHVAYRVCGSQEEALRRARDICLEQTVEMDADLLPAGFIRDRIVGRLEDFAPAPSSEAARSEQAAEIRRVSPKFEATVSYDLESTAFELTQFLNVLFGNTSIKSGIRVQRVDLPPALLSRFRGPRFGIAGLRDLVGAHGRPMLCTALKPMGSPPDELAAAAYHFARGGIDVIKDDHGLSDQPFCPFRARVEACAEAVRRANAESGRRAIYVPNVTAPAHEVAGRARHAREAGAGGILVAPGLVGMDTMRMLADDPDVSLPVISHPAFLGSMVTSPENGVEHGVLFGLLQRLAGADASVFPNYGGRFGFTRDECASIATSCRSDLGPLRPAFPAPGGGMSLERIPELRDLYGLDVIFLVGGALYGRSPDLEANARHFLGLVDG